MTKARRRWPIFAAARFQCDPTMPPPKSTDLGSSRWRRLEERRYRTDEGVDIRWRTPSPNLVCKRSVTLVSGVPGFRARSKIGPHLAVCTCRPRSFRRATTCPGKVLMLASKTFLSLNAAASGTCSKESLPRIFPLVRGGAAKRRASVVLKIYGLSGSLWNAFVCSKGSPGAGFSKVLPGGPAGPYA
jgi:hypothetical protein